MRLLIRAAFEAVSKYTLRPVNPIDGQSVIDIRFTRLPSDLSLSDDEFDPHMHREHPTSIKVWMAYFNLVRTGFGAGVLGVPLAISQAGIVLGPTLALLTAFLLVHTHLTLLRCLNDISRHLKIPHISYRYGFRMAVLHGPSIFKCVGRRGPTIIATFMLLSQLGICTVFVTFTSDSLRDMMDWEDSKPSLLVLLIPYLLLEYFMKTLKIVSYVAMIGNLLSLVGFVLIFYHVFKEPHGEVVSAATEALPVLFAFGTFLFNMSAVGVILSLDRALLDPKVMTKRYGVVKVGMLGPTTFAIFFGVLGYWSFGQMEENVLRSLPFDDDTAMASIGLYMIAVAFAYPIQCYPAIQIIIEVIKYYNVNIEPSEQTLKMVELFARPLFVLLSFIVSYLVPFQGPFVSFVGNVCTSMLALVFPAIMDISLMYPGPYGKYKVHLVKNILIMILGFISCVFGASLCGYLIYIRMMTSSPSNTDYY